MCNLLSHDLVTEVNELCDCNWAVLTVVLVELGQNCVDIVVKEIFFLGFIPLLLLLFDCLLHILQCLFGAVKFPVELFDGIFKILLDSLLVLLTGGSVEFLHHEANFSEDLGLTLVHLQLKVLSLVRVLLLCILIVPFAFCHALLSSTVGLHEETVGESLEIWDVHIEDFRGNIVLLCGLALGEGVDGAFSGPLPVVEELLEAVDLVHEFVVVTGGEGGVWVA